MSKVLGVVAMAALIAGLASPASATDQNIPLQAVVTSFCKINGTLADSTDAVQTIGVTAGDVTVAAINRTFPVVCNKATDISLTSINGGLNGPTGAANFENVINYTASASGFATVASGSTATTAGAAGNETLGTSTRATPGSANIVVAITPIANTLPLVEGTYNDTLRVRITPQP